MDIFNHVAELRVELFGSHNAGLVGNFTGDVQCALKQGSAVE